MAIGNINANIVNRMTKMYVVDSQSQQPFMVACLLNAVSLRGSVLDLSVTDVVCTGQCFLTEICSDTQLMQQKYRDIPLKGGFLPHAPYFNNCFLLQISRKKSIRFTNCRPDKLSIVIAFLNEI